MISSFVFLLQSRTFNQERTYIKKEITKLSAHYEENDSKIAQEMGNKMWKMSLINRKKYTLSLLNSKQLKKQRKKAKKELTMRIEE